MREEIRRVARGEDPMGVAFDAAHATVKVQAGNYFRR